MVPKKATPLGPRTIYLMNHAQISHVAASFYDVPLDPAGVKQQMLDTLEEAMITKSTSPEPACLAPECGGGTGPCQPKLHKFVPAHYIVESRSETNGTLLATPQDDITVEDIGEDFLDQSIAPASLGTTSKRPS